MLNKIERLKQDIVEVKGKLEDLEPFAAAYPEYKDLKEWVEILEDHLKDHLETTENYICDIR